MENRKTITAEERERMTQAIVNGLMKMPPDERVEIFNRLMREVKEQQEAKSE